MHIAIDARIISSSTGRYVERLLHYLQEIDTENSYSVLVRKSDESYWTPRNSNFSVKIADFDQYSFAEQLGFKQLLDTLSPDLVHFCMPQQPVLYRGKTVTTIHDLTLLNTYNSDKNWLIFHLKQLVGRFVFKRVARTSRFVITPTQYVRDSVLKFARIPENKIIVTYEAADKPATELAPFDALADEEYIMYVGSQSDYKNIRRLILAHQELIKTRPDLKLVLVGKTTGVNGKPAAGNEAWVKQSGFQNVIFTGFVTDEQLTWLYTNTKAYIFPSLMEGFGLPGLEAMAMGAPVISSNTTCLPEVYGEAAEYFNPTDINDMRNVIERILADETRQKELVQAGYEQVTKYSWRRMAEQTHAIYMNALK